MTWRRIVPWACVCAVGVAIAAGFALARRHSRPELPSLTQYPGLPAAFGRALQGARDGAASSGADAEPLRRLARLYQANRLFTEARACYQVVAAGAGGLSARDHYYLAAIAQDESNLDLARDELRATLQADPAYAPARLSLAQVLFKTGQADAAAEEYERVAKADPGNAQASLGLARIDLQKGNDEGAVARLEALVERHPESASAAALLSQVLDRKGETQQAESMRVRSQQIHETVPPDPWMKALQSDCYDLQTLELAFEEYRLAGQLDEALPLLDRLEELDPGGWIPPMLRGWSEKEARRYPEAVKQYRLALKNGGDADKICPLMAAAYLTEGDASGAAAMLAEYHAKFPHSIPILLSYSEVAVRLDDQKLARGLLEQVLQAEPYLYMPNMSMAQILWTAGERDAAAQCLLRVARVFPADIDSRGLLGQYYMGRSEPLAAIPPLEQAVALAGPGHPKRDRLTQMLDSAYLLEGSLEASQGRFADAVQFSEKSIRLAPGGIRGYALKANASMHMKDYKGAAQALGKMASLEADNPSIRMRLGDMEFQEGDRAGAREDWQKALQLAPADAAELREALGRRLAGQTSPGSTP